MRILRWHLRFLLFFWVTLGWLVDRENVFDVMYKIFIECRKCHSRAAAFLPAYTTFWSGLPNARRDHENWKHHSNPFFAPKHTRLLSFASQFLGHQISLLHRRLNEISLKSADTILRINISLWLANTYSMWLLLRRYKWRVLFVCAVVETMANDCLTRESEGSVGHVFCGLFSNLTPLAHER